MSLSVLAVIGLCGTAPLLWAATLPPATNELLDGSKIAAGSVKSDGGASATVVEDNGTRVLQGTFPAGQGYPSVDIPVPAGGWDLSAFAGVQLDVVNKGTSPARAALRVDNEGDWRKGPWNTESVTVPAGQQRTVKVTFGRSYGGNKGYALDAAKIVNFKVFLENPKSEAVLQFKNLKPFGKAGAATEASVPAVNAGAATTPVAAATGNTPPAGGVLLNPAALTDVSTLKVDKGELSLVNENGPGVKLSFEAGSDYPTVDLPVPAGGWNLSAYAGVEAEVTNASTANLLAAVRVDNAGDWKKSPWNTDQTYIPAGQTRPVKVYFGRSYGNKAFDLNSGAVTGIKVFTGPRKAAGALVIKNVKAFGTAAAATASAAGGAPATTASASVAAAPVATGKPAPAGGLLLDPSALADTSTLKTDKGEATLVKENGGAIKLSYPAGTDYPTLEIPVPAGGWNLSAYAGVEAEVTNTGTGNLLTAVRVDNAGDWKKSPWNTDQTYIPAGQTRTVKVYFGRSYGNKAYDLNSGAVTAVKVFVGPRKEAGAILIKSVKAFGTATASPAAATTGGTTGGSTASSVAADPATLKESVNAPSMTGELWTLNEKTDASIFRTQDANATVAQDGGQPALKVEFYVGSQYPNVQFPIPQGGWNLSSFGGVQVDVTNPTAKEVTVHLRVDNPGNWKESPWNTEAVKVPANSTKTVKMVFGQQNGAPAYPLNSKNISAIQVFLIRPKENVALLLKNLKAYGSPAEGTSALTSPADRNKPVTPPTWLGQRPPVEGDWVQTLNENFDGDTLNEKLWSHKTWWSGLLSGQTQRYSAKNVTLENGKLRIKTEKLTGHQYDDPSLPTREYTTGHIITYDKWTQAYGYFESRVKLPTARGLWPAFWMMPDRGPAAGPEGWKRESTKDGGMEIDILEYLTEWGPGRNNVAVHWDGYDKDHKSWGTSNIYYGPTPDGWHTFGLLWEPGKLTWYVDGKKTAEFENERVGRVPAYLLINVQMGSWATKDVDVAKLPDYMEVDYVRAWQLKSRIK